MVPAVLFALVKLYRAIAIVHAIVWHGSGRGVRITPKGVGLLGAALLLDARRGGDRRLVPRARPDGRARRAARLPRRRRRRLARRLAAAPAPRRPLAGAAPGALLLGVGLLFVNVFNVYVTTRLVEGRANTYGALGIAAALLFSLVLVGRLMVVSAELNASLDESAGGDVSGRRADAPGVRPATCVRAGDRRRLHAARTRKPPRGVVSRRPARGS